MTESYARRGRVMPPNNRKQAMLPANAEFIDNPIGTACGFAVTIGKARFFFTPGVPREMRRMLDEQVIPRLLKLGGITGVTRLKRFHSFGIGELPRRRHAGRHAAAFQNGGGIKLGFQAHYPQLETKLAARGDDEADLLARLAPVEAEVRKRLGNFIIAEDDQTLEGVILATLLRARHTRCRRRRCSPAAISRPAWRRWPAPSACSGAASWRAIPASSASTACRRTRPNRSAGLCGRKAAPAMRWPC